MLSLQSVVVDRGGCGQLDCHTECLSLLLFQMLSLTERLLQHLVCQCQSGRHTIQKYLLGNSLSIGLSIHFATAVNLLIEHENKMI